MTGEQFIIYALIVGILGLIPFMLIYGSKIVYLFQFTKVKKLLKKMSLMTGNNIMVMAHMDAGLFGSMIMPTDIIKIEKLLRAFKGKDVDFIVHTLGGDLFSSIKIANLLDDYPGNVRVFIPKYAMSGGSMIALGADEIFMNDNASLGQIDPQVGSLLKIFSSKAWNEILKKKGNKVNDDTIALGMLGNQATKEVKMVLEKLLYNKIKDEIKRKEFIKILTEGKEHHGFQFTPKILEKYMKINHISFDYPDRIIEAKPYKEVFGWKHGATR